MGSHTSGHTTNPTLRPALSSRTRITVTRHVSVFVSEMSTKASKLKKVASAKINHHIGGLRTTIPAQMAVAGPPLATQLGQLGINIQQFVKDFNLRTSIFKEGTPVFREGNLWLYYKETSIRDCSCQEPRPPS